MLLDMLLNLALGDRLEKFPSYLLHKQSHSSVASYKNLYSPNHPHHLPQVSLYYHCISLQDILCSTWLSTRCGNTTDLYNSTMHSCTDMLVVFMHHAILSDCSHTVKSSLHWAFHNCLNMAFKIPKVLNYSDKKNLNTIPVYTCHLTLLCFLILHA